MMCLDLAHPVKATLRQHHLQSSPQQLEWMRPFYQACVCSPEAGGAQYEPRHFLKSSGKAASQSLPELTELSQR